MTNIGDMGDLDDNCSHCPDWRLEGLDNVNEDGTGEIVKFKVGHRDPERKLFISIGIA